MGTFEPTSTFAFRTMRRTDDDLRMLQDLFVASGSPKQLDKLRWQYWKPDAPLLVDCLANDTQFGAVYAISPVRFRCGDNVVWGSQSLDTLTGAAHRGKGLFVKLASSVYQRAGTENVELVYGFPNQHSAHGFFTKLGWTNLDPVPFLIRPLRSAYWTERLSKKYLRGVSLPNVAIPLLPQRTSLPITNVITFDERFTELWHRSCNANTVGIERDATYLRWRLSKPDENYQTLAIFERDTLLAFVTFTVKAKHGGSIGYVMELLHDRTRPDAGAQVLHAAMREMKSQNADAVLAWNLAHSPQRPAYHRVGFFPLPEKLRPIELHFGVRAIGSSMAATSIGNRRSWYLSYLDSDTV
jgi:GNAT superfamily N-acetyltransferase